MTGPRLDLVDTLFHFRLKVFGELSTTLPQNAFSRFEDEYKRIVGVKLLPAL